VIDQDQRIICVDTANGKLHDFALFKKSKLGITKGIKVKVDLGYTGIKKYHQNSELPKKSSKKHPLTDKDKKENQDKASQRIFIEHINAKVKTFQILKQKYRNRRKRYNLRVNLICGMINFDKNIHENN